MKLAIAAVAVAALTGSALGQVTENAIAFETGTIQPAGPRQGNNGNNFFNIEGETNGAFASYGVARWDLSSVRSTFDTTFGAGNWQVTAIRLEMTQDNAAFTFDGQIDLYYSTDDATDIKTLGSPLTWPFFDQGLPDLALGNGGATICDYLFIEGVTAQIDSYDQSGGPNGSGEALLLAADLTADIENDSLLTLVFVDGDLDVAATYRGQASFQGKEGPKLFITAEQSGGGCYADCDGSGSLNIFDYICFGNAYSAQQSYADCDGNSAFNIFDYICFGNAYAAGCP